MLRGRTICKPQRRLARALQRLPTVRSCLVIALLPALSACACERNPVPHAAEDLRESARPLAAARALPAPRVYASGQYPLDALDRQLQPSAPSSKLDCAPLTLHEFTGGSIKFSPPAQVIEPFRERLVELERIIVETSSRMYGQVPESVLVSASYHCRPVTGNKARISEHALGNAIDIAGFRFDTFEVRVDRHWNARGAVPELRHEQFLRELTRAIVDHDLFRTLLGPAHPDHTDHFHFDMAPWNYVRL